MSCSARFFYVLRYNRLKIALDESFPMNQKSSLCDDCARTSPSCLFSCLLAVVSFFRCPKILRQKTYQLAVLIELLGIERRTYAEDVSCLCGLDLETPEHLFVGCPLVQPVLSWFSRSWRSITGRSPPSLFAAVPPVRSTPRRRPYWQLLSLAYPELLYSIWLQRCSAIFDDAPFSSVIIVALFKHRLRRALEAAVRLKAVPGFTTLADALTTAVASASFV